MANERLDPHERPPAFVRDAYKFYQKLSKNELDVTKDIVDFSRASGTHSFVKHHEIFKATAVAACCHLNELRTADAVIAEQEFQVYEATDIPGLRVIPSLLPRESQVDILSRLLHRDLADPRHKTNVQLHHQAPYHATKPSVLNSLTASLSSSRISFFNISPDNPEPFIPLDAKVHKPLTVSQFLNRKLRWVTLGGQYDWTHKKYPPENPPFPADIAAFIHGLFPQMTAEAAIVNIYSPGDTLSVHRDVSERSDQGLVSISFGCDAIFVVGLGSEIDANGKALAIRLRSGDAVYMSGNARFAWHGVPQIIPNTCPEWLRSWPAKGNAEGMQDNADDPYEPWRDWMSGKRINLNVRQMKD